MSRTYKSRLFVSDPNSYAVLSFVQSVFFESNEYNTQNIHSILYEFIQSVKFVNIQPSEILVIKDFLGN